VPYLAFSRFANNDLRRYRQTIPLKEVKIGRSMQSLFWGHFGVQYGAGACEAWRRSSLCLTGGEHPRAL